MLQTDAQGDGKTGGTLWLSLVSLPTLVVLSFESLRSSFIYLPSRGCYRDGVVHVLIQNSRTSRRGSEGFPCCLGCRGRPRTARAARVGALCRRMRTILGSFGEYGGQRCLPVIGSKWLPCTVQVALIQGGRLLSRSAVVQARVPPSEENEFFSRDWL